MKRSATVQTVAGVARKALREMDDKSRHAMLWVISEWLHELDNAERRNRYAPQRVAALRVRNMLRDVAREET